MSKKDFFKIEKIKQEVDIAEDEFLKKYPEVLSILLEDKTTNTNIIWATDNYQHISDNYKFFSPIKIELITGENNKVIMPRILSNGDRDNKIIKTVS